jgi:hypothetical protein
MAAQNSAPLAWAPTDLIKLARIQPALMR